MIEPALLIFFGLQSVIFAAWVVLSLAILIGMALRAVSRRETGSALVVCGVVTVVILMTI